MVKISSPRFGVPTSSRPFLPLPWSTVGPVGQWALISSAWFVTGSASFLRYALASEKTGPVPEILLLWGDWLLCYSPWILVTPLLAHVIERWPLRGEGWGWRLPGYAVLGIPVVWLVAAGDAVLRSLPNPGRWSFAAPTMPAINVFLQFTLFCGATAVLEAMSRFSMARRHEQELADLQVRRLELENDLRDAQLEALRMKLNPHFLFNALQTVTALMRTDAPAAERMLSRLGDVLRMALRLDLACEIPLSAELDVARAYLDLERQRFRDRLSVTIDVESDLNTALVPSLILQPIVENSIKHGVSRVRTKADLRIDARRTEDHLLIRVTDNGAGIQDHGDRGVGYGVGLGVLQSRLQKLYPGQADCRIQNRPEGGAEVEIRLPFHTSAAAAEVTH